MEAHVARMANEEKELRVKVKNLDVFIKTNPIFEELDKNEQRRMINQLAGMNVYLSSLSERLMVHLSDF